MILSREDLEKISQRVLRAYRELPEAQKTPWKVDPELLTRSLLGLKLEYRHLDDEGQTLGLTCFGCCELELPDSAALGPCVLDGKTVVVESDLLRSERLMGRKNFTVAHEASHHILKMLWPRAYDDGLLCYRLKRRGEGSFSWEEWQMEVLASCLLMPEELVLQWLDVMDCRQENLGRGAPFRSVREEKFRWIAEQMGVSRQALAYRLERLGLVRAPYLQSLYGGPDIKADEEWMKNYA